MSFYYPPDCPPRLYLLLLETWLDSIEGVSSEELLSVLRAELMQGTVDEE